MGWEPRTIRRPGPGMPPQAWGATPRRLVVELSSRADKAALIDESDALGLPLGEYVRRVLFNLRARDRARLASAKPTPRTIDAMLSEIEVEEP